MKPTVRIVAKILLILPVCLATLMGPFFLARWLRATHGIDVPSFLVLGVALFVTFIIYFGFMKKDLREAEERWRQRKKQDV